MNSERNIVLGVTGGIAAYKSAELVRLLKKDGFAVRVAMTKSAEAFVGALTFEALSGLPVVRGLEEGAGAMSHIELSRWGHLFVVAPATANFLAKMAAGLADDALSTEVLAFRGPVLVAPAMNTAMWEAPATKANMQTLRSRGVQVVGPAAGELACGDVGEGKMSEPVEILARVKDILGSAPRPLAGKKVLITSGPTRTWLDSVRFLTNRSSGRMGHAMAVAAEDMGADVVLVTGPVAPQYAQLSRGKVIEVDTGEEMFAACDRELDSADIVIAAAAVCDFDYEKAEGKMRREGEVDFHFTASRDVVASLAARKRPGQRFIGFAAEWGEGREKAQEKLAKKKLDALALNDVSRSDIGFESAENEFTIFVKKSDGQVVETKLAKESKGSVARRLLEACAL